MKFSRSTKSGLSDWWWTIDRVQLGAILILIIFGIVLNLAASPPIAERLNYSDQYYFVKQFIFIVFGALVTIFFSFLNLRNIRRLCLLIFAVSLISIFFINIFGAEIKGAAIGWILVLSRCSHLNLQKPAFVVLISWLMSESILKKAPGKSLSFILYVLFIIGLILQPDIGQAILVTLSASIIYFITGMPLIIGVIIFLLSLTGIALSYIYIDHFTQRLNIFLNPNLGDTYQIDTAYNAIINGGWFGVGPGEGTIKNILPDAHTDFIFAVAAEEFGLISCFIIIFLFAFIIFRGVKRSINQQNLFAKNFNHWSYLTNLLTDGYKYCCKSWDCSTKGMTLPFISYGGSSAISIAITFGLILAFTRQKEN